MNEFKSVTDWRSSVTLLSAFPFDHVAGTLKSLSYKREPDPEVNLLFEVDETTLHGDKYLLEFVEDGIRIYKEDGIDKWKFVETVLLERVKSCFTPPGSTGTIYFEWNRGQDGSLHQDTYKTDQAKLIADSLFRSVQEKLTLRKLGQELKIMNIWSGNRGT